MSSPIPLKGGIITWLEQWARPAFLIMAWMSQLGHPCHIQSRNISKSNNTCILKFNHYIQLLYFLWGVGMQYAYYFSKISSPFLKSYQATFPKLISSQLLLIGLIHTFSWFKANECSVSHFSSCCGKNTLSRVNRYMPKKSTEIISVRLNIK